MTRSERVSSKSTSSARPRPAPMAPGGEKSARSASLTGRRRESAVRRREATAAISSPASPHASSLPSSEAAARVAPPSVDRDTSRARQVGLPPPRESELASRLACSVRGEVREVLGGESSTSSRRRLAPGLCLRQMATRAPRSSKAWHPFQWSPASTRAGLPRRSSTGSAVAPRSFGREAATYSALRACSVASVSICDEGARKRSRRQPSAFSTWSRRWSCPAPSSPRPTSTAEMAPRCHSRCSALNDLSEESTRRLLPLLRTRTSSEGSTRLTNGTHEENCQWMVISTSGMPSSCASRSLMRASVRVQVCARSRLTTAW
mmetsp:Transcript_10234/g.30315  ORF Transcript_10234/g.30315 Transcript_10234/m.30315 type:complete len:320 (-) Transcript_10234:363-1322(-)